MRCKNCFGTGTIFVGKSKLGVSKKCPVCHGTCKVSPSVLADGARRTESQPAPKEKKYGNR